MFRATIQTAEPVQRTTYRGCSASQPSRTTISPRSSDSVCEHRKITVDLRDLGERCSRHRVHRRMRTEELRARLGYDRKLRFHLGMQCFFGLLKRERIRRRIYPTKDAARAAVFDYIEMF